MAGTPSIDVFAAGASRPAGVLPNQLLERAIDEGVIAATDGSGIPASNIQPGSLDLRLGDVAYRLRCSFLPDRHPVERKLEGLVMGELSLSGSGAVLDKGRPYLIPLKECLRLPDGMRAKANPKSSTGRVDVFTRVISDRSYTFDEILPAYEGRLYLEVVPLSFAVKVRENLSLNQLRLSIGSAKLTDADLVEFHRQQPVLFESDTPVREDGLAVVNGLFLGLNLKGDHAGRVGYRAKANAPLLDLSQVGQADPQRYWESMVKERGDRIVLQPREFYLLMSNEAVTIPPSVAAEMTAYDPTSGELRTHYAGFFDPGFGYAGDGPEAERGSMAALEVRAHDVPFMIEHRQRVCKLTFEWMLEPPTQLYGGSIQSNYQRQIDPLGKHFAVPGPSKRKDTADGAQLALLDLDR